MRFLTVFLIVSCFVASEAFFGEDIFKGPGDFFTGLMDKLKELTGGKEDVPATGNNSSLPDLGPIPEIDENGEPRPISPAQAQKK